jgi:RHS repeat-associated protein
MLIKKIKLIVCIFSILVLFKEVSFVYSQSVGPDGSFGYSVPITLPPGLNGVQPSLSLDYNSVSQNGLMGVGWSLNGLPSITRNMSYGVNYDGNDHYVTNDGDDLVKSSDGSYHSKIENFSKFVPSDKNQGDAPLYWIEYKPDGSKLYYGDTSDISNNASCNAVSYLYDRKPCIRVWALSRAEDANGNYYDVTYNQYSDGSYSPSRITYSLLGNSSRYCVIDFDYSGRDDVWAGDKVGSKLEISKRLTKISVRSDALILWGFKLWSNVFRTYDVDYDYGLGSKSYVSKITERDSAGDAIDQHSMTYSANNSSPWQETLPGYVENQNASDYRQSVGDFDGDGKTDIAWRHTGWDHWDVTYGNGTAGAMPCATIDRQYDAGYAQETGDFNGDGLTDIAWRRAAWPGWNLTYGGGTTGFLPGSCDRQYDADEGKYREAEGDFDGDGKDDIAWRRNQWQGWNVSLGNGTTGFMYGPTTAEEYTQDYKYTQAVGDFNGDGKIEIAWMRQNWPSWSYSYWGNTSVKVLPGTCDRVYDSSYKQVQGDFDGDGRDDIAWRRGYWGGWRISYGNGLYYISDSPIDAQADNDYKQCVGDFDGDGRTDIAWTRSGWGIWRIYYGKDSLGQLNTNETRSLSTEDYSQAVGDFDGDGRSDIAWRFSGEEVWSIVYGNGMLGSMPGKVETQVQTISGGEDDPDINNDYNQVEGDFNGDGRTDIAWRCTGWDHWDVSYSGKGVPSGLLQKISKKNGTEVVVGYQNATDTDNAIQPKKSVNPYVVNNNERQLVMSISKSDGRGGVFSSSYSYYNGKRYSGQVCDRKDLYFEYILQKNDQTEETQKTYYIQTDFLSGGMPWKVETFNGNGNPLTSKVITYSISKSLFGTQVVQTDTEKVDVFESGVKRFQTSKSYFYDCYGNMNKSIVCDGVNTVTQTVSYDIDTANWFLSRPNESKTVTSSGKVLSWQRLTYEKMNPVTKTAVLVDDNGLKEITSVYKYYADGRIHYITNPQNQKVSFVYDGDNTIITDPLGHTVIKKIDPATGKLTCETDENGYSLTTTYDTQGRVSQIKEGSNITKEIFYVNEDDPNNQYVETRVMDTSALGYSFTRSYYDGLGKEYKQVSKKQSDDGISGLFQITEKKYNFKGQLETQTGPFIASDITGINSDNKFVTNYFYDSSNRITQVSKNTSKGFLSASTTYTASGSNLKVVSTDPKGNSTTSVYDPRGILVQKNEPEGGYIVYGYDEAGRLTSTNANGSVTSINYDTLGRRTSISDPDKGLTSYTYNDSGLVESMTDAMNQTTVYTYDAAGRLVKEDNPDGTRDVVYSYDTSSHGINRLAQVSDGEVTTVYSYDVNGNISSTNQIIDKYNFRFGMEYDIQRHVTKMTYPLGKKIQNVYSDTGELAAVCSLDDSDNISGAFVKYGIDDPNSYVSTSTNANPEKFNSVTMDQIRSHKILRHTADGINTVIGYEPSTQRPTSIQSFYGNNGRCYDNLSYEYDNDGNITKIADSLSSIGTQTFEYDGINRLTKAIGSYGTESYNYNPNGNLYQKGGKTLKYNSASHPHAVTSVVGGSSYGYDATGNMITRGVDTLTYDAKNRLVSLSNNTKKEDYVYDHAGQRVKKTKKDGTVVYSIGGLYELTVVPNYVPAHTMYIYGLKGDLVAQRTYSGSAYTSQLAKNNFLDGLNTSNPFKRIFYTVAYALVKDRGLSGEIQKIAPWVFLGIGFSVFFIFTFLRFRTRRQSTFFKRFCADLIPLVLCVFIAGTGLSACGTPNIPDDPDDPIYTDVKSSPAPAVSSEPKSSASTTATPSPQTTNSSTSSPSSSSTNNSASSVPANPTATMSVTPSAESSASSGTGLSSGGENLNSGGSTVSTIDSTGIPVNGTYYFHPDHLGNIRYMTKPVSGSEPLLIWQTAYTPYGERLSSSENGTMTTHKTYTGQSDDLTGLMYYNARYYDPSIGRFITADDVIPDPDKSQSYNRYMYVDGNPVNGRDPSGHWSLGGVVSACVGAVLGGATGAGVAYSAYKAVKGGYAKAAWKGSKNWVNSNKSTAIGGAIGSAVCPGLGSAVGGVVGYYWDDIVDHKNEIIGGSIGSLAFPGVGTVIGGFIGHKWDDTFGSNEWRHEYLKKFIIGVSFCIDPVNTIIAIDAYLNYNDAPGGNWLQRSIYSLVITTADIVSIYLTVIGLITLFGFGSGLPAYGGVIFCLCVGVYIFTDLYCRWTNVSESNRKEKRSDNLEGVTPGSGVIRVYKFVLD